MAKSQEWADRGLRVLLVAYYQDPTCLRDEGDASQLPSEMTAASLVPAVAEGQRIVNGLQDVLKLFIARIATVTMVILSSLAIALGIAKFNFSNRTLQTTGPFAMPFYAIHHPFVVVPGYCIVRLLPDFLLRVKRARRRRRTS